MRFSCGIEYGSVVFKFNCIERNSVVRMISTSIKRKPLGYGI